MTKRIDRAEELLRTLEKRLGYARQSLARWDVPGVDGALYRAVAEVELRRARELAPEAFAAVDLATATPEPRS